jgi:hypothetical protein
MAQLVDVAACFGDPFYPIGGAFIDDPCAIGHPEEVAAGLIHHRAADPPTR